MKKSEYRMPQNFWLHDGLSMAQKRKMAQQVGKGGEGYMIRCVGGSQDGQYIWYRKRIEIEFRPAKNAEYVLTNTKKDGLVYVPMPFFRDYSTRKIEFAQSVGRKLRHPLINVGDVIADAEAMFWRRGSKSQTDVDERYTLQDIIAALKAWQAMLGVPRAQSSRPRPKQHRRTITKLTSGDVIDAGDPE